MRKDLLDLCTETAQKFLVQGKCELAVPGALQSLKFAIEVYGSEATELVPSYLLLAEANLGLRRLKIAEEFLSLANWNILKHPQAGSSMMSNLQRNFGRLYAAQQKYNEALQAFATDIYHSSLEFGPENIRSAPSYFHMGRVFRHQKPERAAAFYQKVVDISTKFLENFFKEEGKCPENNPHGPRCVEVPGVEAPDITPVEIEEAIEIIKHISEYREKQQEEKRKDRDTERLALETAESRYTLGLLHFYTGDLFNGKDCLSQALDDFLAVVGTDDPRTQNCMRHLGHLDERMKKTDPGKLPPSLNTTVV